MPKANAPGIVNTKSRSFDGALRCATTHPTLKVINIALNIISKSVTALSDIAK
ncbi:hypothetical protein BDGGKGIB_01485 [Nodularia sphaerocarpa UHCC 0038]|nr:hypothetical protein BDGGKGIB_01485 [Nodularia sphaerocarpa UHCC 0038]